MNLQYKTYSEIAENLGIEKPVIDDPADLFWRSAFSALIDKIDDNYTPMKVIEMAMDKGKMITVETCGELSIVKIGEESVIPVRKNISIEFNGEKISKESIIEIINKINYEIGDNDE